MEKARLKFDGAGLIPAVIQDDKTGQVLMVAFMNRQALAKTLKTGLVHFYSRSRKKLWLKGETSGHVQKLKSLLVDCDGDCLLIRVDQKGAACHAGYRSCFFRVRRGKDRWVVVGKRVFDPEKVYGKK